MGTQGNTPGNNHECLLLPKQLHAYCLEMINHYDKQSLVDCDKRAIRFQDEGMILHVNIGV